MKISGSIRAATLGVVTRALVGVFALATSALASPAQDLFNQATYFVAVRYNGFSETEFANFNEKYQPELDTACATQLEFCPYTVAIPIVQRMMSELNDAHSYYLSPQQNLEMQRQRSGLGGSTPRLGLILQDAKEGFERIVASVWAGSPAEKAGLKRGDRITGINGRSSGSYGATFRLEMSKIVGTGKDFVLNIRRAGQPLALKTRGEPVRSPLPTYSRLNNRVAYIRLPGFDVAGQVSSTTRTLMQSVVKEGFQRLIVDVRDNPGGLVFETLGAVGTFVPKTGFVQVSRDGEIDNRVENGLVTINGVELSSGGSVAAFKGKLIVLVNQNSYSGAEYFAQLIQDATRGTIVGDVTGGLGNTVTTPFDLLDGSAIAITIAKSARLNDGGFLPARVTPDVAVTDDLELQSLTGKDAVLEKALELLR
jgi:carboxyl-terminal processing protease